MTQQYFFQLVQISSRGNETQNMLGLMGIGAGLQMGAVRIELPAADKAFADNLLDNAVENLPENIGMVEPAFTGHPK
nr:hypothetical protein [Xenorhabdus sp. Flor]